MSIFSIQTKKELILHQIAILKQQVVKDESVKEYITKVVASAEEWVSNDDEENNEKSYLEMSQTMQHAIQIAAATRESNSLTQNWIERNPLDPLSVCNLSEASEDVEEALSSLEKEQPGKHVIAFIASCIYNLKEPSVFSPFTNYTSISGNESGHFDPQKGVFTVPVDGMYLVCVSLALVSPRGSLRVIVVRNMGDEESLEICSVSLDESQNENSSTLLSQLKMGDNLHIILRESSGYTQFEAKLNFACSHLR